MTYFRRGNLYYHWRGSVSPSCSGWEGVVPLCYGRQTKGGKKVYMGWVALFGKHRISAVLKIIGSSLTGN